MSSVETMYNPYTELQQKNPALASEYEELWQRIYQDLKKNPNIGEISLATWFNDIFIVAVSQSAIALYILLPSAEMWLPPVLPRPLRRAPKR